MGNTCCSGRNHQSTPKPQENTEISIDRKQSPEKSSKKSSSKPPALMPSSHSNPN